MKYFCACLVFLMGVSPALAKKDPVPQDDVVPLSDDGAPSQPLDGSEVNLDQAAPASGTATEEWPTAPEPDAAPAKPAKKKSKKSAKKEAPAPEEATQGAAAEPAPTGVDSGVPAEEPLANENQAPAAETLEPVSPAAPEPIAASPAPASSGSGYAVKKGDTLWDLAGQFYGNSFDWPRIWEANKADIKDPDLIYPDQTFSIPGGPSPGALSRRSKATGYENLENPMAETPAPAVSEATAAPEGENAEAGSLGPSSASGEEQPSAPAEEAAPAPRVEKRPRGGPVESGTFISEKSWNGDGQILGEKDQKILIGQADFIYLNIGSNKGLRPGARGDIYRKGRLVKDPATDNVLGCVVRRVGTIEVTREVSDNTATALILVSNEPIKIGDIIKLTQ